MNLNTKICKNCKHFFISGMFQSWGGTAGYWMLIKNNIEEKSSTNEYKFSKIRGDTIKQITETCHRFEVDK